MLMNCSKKGQNMALINVFQDSVTGAVVPVPNIAQHNMASGFCNTVMIDYSPAHNISTNIANSTDAVSPLQGIVSGKFSGECLYMKGSSKVLLDNKPSTSSNDITSMSSSSNGSSSKSSSIIRCSTR